MNGLNRNIDTYDKSDLDDLPCSNQANGLVDAVSTNLTKLSHEWRQRFKTSLTNARYNLTSGARSMFSGRSSICLYGKLYCPNADDLHSESDHSPCESDALPPFSTFLETFSQIHWFTYRRGFEISISEKYDTDCGWGCMLRCGQMLLARTLLVHFRAVDCGDDPVVWDDVDVDRTIIGQFIEDSAARTAPFSLHRLVQIGAELFKSQAGEWFAPGATAYILRGALHSWQQRQRPNERRALMGAGLTVHVVSECVLCIAELPGGAAWTAADAPVGHLSASAQRRLRSVLAPRPEPNVQEDVAPPPGGVLVVVPLRLGGDRFNAAYAPRLKKLLSLQCCVGMMGGRPKRSLYVVGWHHESALCLDPHYCHDTVPVDAASLATFPIESFFCPAPQKISFNEMDPSCAIGFYIADRDALITFLIELLDVCTFGIGDAEACRQPVFSVLYSRDELARPAKSRAPRCPGVPPRRTLKSRTESCSSSTGYEML